MDRLNSMDEAQVNSPTLMSEVKKLQRIYYTLPVTAATAERTFSAMRKLKNYMRATMTQKRLNNKMLMHCYIDDPCDNQTNVLQMPRPPLASVALRECSWNQTHHIFVQVLPNNHYKHQEVFIQTATCGNKK